MAAWDQRLEMGLAIQVKNALIKVEVVPGHALTVLVFVV